MAVAAKDLMLKGTSLRLGDRGSILVKKITAVHHALPVVNDAGEVVGIVSEQRIRRALLGEQTLFRSTAEALMTCGHREHDHCPHPVCVPAEAPIADVIRTMFRERLSSVPVVQNRKLVGIINRKDLDAAMRLRPPE